MNLLPVACSTPKEWCCHGNWWPYLKNLIVCVWPAAAVHVRNVQLKAKIKQLISIHYFLAFPMIQTKNNVWVFGLYAIIPFIVLLLSPWQRPGMFLTHRFNMSTRQQHIHLTHICSEWTNSGSVGRKDQSNVSSVAHMLLSVMNLPQSH